MKSVRLVLLLLLVMTSTFAFSQKYYFSGPPLEGYMYVDPTADKNEVVYSSSDRCANIVSDNKTVFASGKGIVISCNPTSAKTYEIVIDYGHSVVKYINVINKKVFKSQVVELRTEIGDLPLNPKDRQYHLGLQVMRSDDPTEILWGHKLAQYLNATQVSDRIFSEKQ